MAKTVAKAAPPIVVQKYGGTSLADPEAVRRVARRVVETRRTGCRLVVVVSAMGHSTEHLVDLARAVAPNPGGRELDVLLASGEQASMALLSLAIRALGVEAVALSGAQCGILTNDVHGNARILEVAPERVRRELDRGTVVVAAGFQGVDGGGELTTLGRGGSDTTAVALAAALGAERCEIFTDVDGVYTADPRRIPEARRLEAMSCRVAQELTWHGAQVLKAEAVELASTNGVAITVRSTFDDGPGTAVLPDAAVDVAGTLEGAARETAGRPVGEPARQAPAYVPHHPAIAGVSSRTDLLRLAVSGSAFAGARRRELFTVAGRYDLIFCSLAGAGGALTLYLSTLEISEPAALAAELEDRFGTVVEVEVGLGAVSLVGFGLGSRPASLLDALERLQAADVAVRDGFSSRDSYSFVVPAAQADAAARTLHHAFLELERAAEAVRPAPVGAV